MIIHDIVKMFLADLIRGPYALLIVAAISCSLFENYVLVTMFLLFISALSLS